MRTVIGVLLACVLSLVAIGLQTDGFTVLTTEAARRNDIANHPRELPRAILQDSSGVSHVWQDELASDGRVTIVNFIYTRCASICFTMGTELQQLQDAIAQLGLEDRVRLLSVSFDASDTPEYLARYARAMKAKGRLWQFASIPEAGERNALLNAFGIVVVKAPMGQFEHNAAYHVVGPDGRLHRIVDVGDVMGALEYADVLSRSRRTVKMAATQAIGKAPRGGLQ